MSSNDIVSAEVDFIKERPAASTYKSRSLDEAYYPGLNMHQLSTRNGDQVISRIALMEEKPQRVLFVPQLWIWKLDNVVVSALSSRGDNIGDTVVTDRIGESWAKSNSHDTTLLVAMILSEYINLLDRPLLAYLQDPLFFTFEKAVALTFEEVQAYVKEASMDSIKIDKEKDFMHKISDIREELVMIQSIVTQQRRVWNEFWKENFESNSSATAKTSNEQAYSKNKPDNSKPDPWKGVDEETKNILRKMVERPIWQIPLFLERIDKIDKDAERVEKWIASQLDLKVKHASLKESHNSTVLSTAVIGFTVITIIFTPLAFLASLLALPIERFTKLQSNATAVTGEPLAVYTTNYTGTWFGKSSEFYS